jgi:hypothetical protein
MHARSITFMGDPGRLAAGIDYVRDDVMPMLTATDGCVGMSMLADHDSGQAIVTSSWRSAEEMHASNPLLTGSRARAAEIMGAPPEAAEWEVAVMHRDHRAAAGSCCRVTWLRLGHADLDRGTELYRTALLPAMEELPGFCSASLLVNRVAGRACSTTTYDSREAMEATRDRSWAIRDAGVREAGVDVLDVGEFDLVLAHLHVPELV